MPAMPQPARAATAQGSRSGCRSPQVRGAEIAGARIVRTRFGVACGQCVTYSDTMTGFLPQCYSINALSVRCHIVPVELFFDRAAAVRPETPAVVSVREQRADAVRQSAWVGVHQKAIH